MVLEHEQGRQFVKGMADNIEAASNGEPSALEAYVSAARGYVQLLRAHIKKEDGVLFPMADRVFSDDDQQKLLATFDKVESEHMGEGTHDKYLRIAESLADRYGVPKDNIAGHSCGCANKS
jgi:hemerythrin-like domain-containing protein